VVIVDVGGLANEEGGWRACSSLTSTDVCPGESLSVLSYSGIESSIILPFSNFNSKHSPLQTNRLSSYAYVPVQRSLVRVRLRTWVMMSRSASCLTVNSSVAGVCMHELTISGERDGSSLKLSADFPLT